MQLGTLDDLEMIERHAFARGEDHLQRLAAEALDAREAYDEIDAKLPDMEAAAEAVATACDKLRKLKLLLSTNHLEEWEIAEALRLTDDTLDALSP